MSDTIVQKGEGRLRPPSNMREVLALALALVIVLAIIQIGAPIVRQLTFIDEKIRESVIGLAFFAFPFINRTIKQLLDRSSGSGLVRPDLSPWFVTGFFAATLMFAWNQLVSFLSSVAIYTTLRQAVDGPTLGGLGGAISQGQSIMLLPMALVAAIYGGMLLNRYTRSGVLLALILAAVGQMALSIGSTLMLATTPIDQTLAAAGGLATLATGLGALALFNFLALGVGVIISRIKRDRSIGRLLNAARQLPPQDRDEVTSDVVRRLEKKT
jgi:hypothetical protein